MTKDQVLGIVRHLLTAVGGWLIATGAIDESLAAESSGAIITLVGVIWSLLAKRSAGSSPAP